MKKKLLVIGVIACIIIGIQAVLTASDKMTVSMTEHNIYYDDVLSNGYFENPMFTYNDLTYISIRDFAAMIKKRVHWIEEDNEIRFAASKSDYEVIKKPETALAIGKAIIEEYYPDRIQKNSIFHASYAQITTSSKENCYETRVLFDPPSDIELDQLYILNHPDVIVEISLKNGSFILYEKDADGRWNQVTTESPAISPMKGDVPSSITLWPEE